MGHGPISFSLSKFYTASPFHHDGLYPIELQGRINPFASNLLLLRYLIIIMRIIANIPIDLVSANCQIYTAYLRKES